MPSSSVANSLQDFPAGLAWRVTATRGLLVKRTIYRALVNMRPTFRTESINRCQEEVLYIIPVDKCHLWGEVCSIGHRTLLKNSPFRPNFLKIKSTPLVPLVEFKFAAEISSPSVTIWARIVNLLRSLGIDSKEPIPSAYAAWRAGTITLFLAPIDCLKIPALSSVHCLWVGGGGKTGF
jgi:hypothetical protein